MAHGSVISWQHINLLGEYDFSNEKLRNSVGIRPPKLTPKKVKNVGLYVPLLEFNGRGLPKSYPHSEDPESGCHRDELFVQLKSTIL